MYTEKSTRLFAADDLIQFRILSKTNKLKIALEIILLPVRIKKKNATVVGICSVLQRMLTSFE